MQTVYPSLSQPVVETSQSVCVAGHKLEADAGATMLEQGGNAYDALVASAFMGFVVEQIDCGLGGFAHVSVWNNANKNFYEIDGYVTAPLKSHETMFEIDDGISYYGHPFTKNDAAKFGPLAAIITAVGWDYGSLVYEPDTGIFLNNGMSYFDPRPGRPNSIGPGKRPLFGAPCIVMAKDSQPVFAACGSGGYRITTGVLHSLINTIDHGMEISSALDHPRVHMQGNETFLDHRIDPCIQEKLQRAGHIVVPLQEEAAAFNFGRVCALSVGTKSHRISASAYPHWITAASIPS